VSQHTPQVIFYQEIHADAKNKNLRLSIKTACIWDWHEIEVSAKKTSRISKD